MPETIVVSTSLELTDAYTLLAASAEGGTIVLAEGAGPFEMDSWDFSEQIDAPVTITSETPEAPETLTFVKLRNRENITFDNVNFEAAKDELAAHQPVVRMQGVTNVSVTNSTLSSDAQGVPGTPDETAVAGANLVYIYDSVDITFTDNLFEDAMHGIQLSEVNNAVISENEFRAIQGDGIRLGGVQDIDISNNWMHDFTGTTQDYNHSDYIQYWGTNIQQNNERITIDSNILDAGDGQSYQMIFGRNEHFSTNGFVYEDIVVSNNVIYSAGYHMITMGGTEGAEVINNSVLYNIDAKAIMSDGSSQDVADGWIHGAEGDETDLFSGNIAAVYVDADGNNTQLTPIDQLQAFVNLYAGGSGDLRDLQLAQDSPLWGTAGSSILWMQDTSDALIALGVAPLSGTLLAVAAPDISTTDKSVVSFDAGYSRNSEGFIDETATITWTFDDGTVLTGAQVTHDFETGGLRSYTLRVENALGEVDEITRTIEIEKGTPLVIDVVDGQLTNSQDPATTFKTSGTVTLTEDGFVTSPDSYVMVERDSGDFMFEMNAFEFGVTLTPLEDTSGVIFMIHTTMRATLENDGSVKFWIEMQDGRFELQTDPGVFSGEETHRVSVRYDSGAELLEILIDGEVAASTTATGYTKPEEHWSLTYGDNYGDNFQAEYSDIVLSVEYYDDGSPNIEFATGFDGPVHEKIWLVGDALVEGWDGMALDLEAGGKIRRTCESLFDSDGFSLGFELRLDEPGQEGHLFHLAYNMESYVRADGRLTFSMTTVDGTFAVTTDADLLSDGAVHALAFEYDATTEIMRILVDGSVAGLSTATGLTLPPANHDLCFGHTWDQSRDLTGLVDNIVVRDGPQLIGADLTPVAEDRLISLAFEGDTFNLVANSIETEEGRGSLDYVASGDGQAAVFDRQDSVEIAFDPTELYGHDAFVFDMDLTLNDNGNHTVLYMHMGLKLWINKGQVFFSMENENDTAFVVQSEGAVMQVGQEHNLQIAFSDAADQLALYVDGSEVGSTFASGIAMDKESWAFQIGGPAWKQGFDGVLDNFELSITDILF